MKNWSIIEVTPYNFNHKSPGKKENGAKMIYAHLFINIRVSMGSTVSRFTPKNFPFITIASY